MIVVMIWKLTFVVRVGLAPRSSHSQRQGTFPDNVCFPCPPLTVSHSMKIWLRFVFLRFFFSSPKELGAARAMGKRGGHTNSGEGVKGKTGRTTSHDAGGKTCEWEAGAFWTQPWLTWCRLNEHLKSSWKRSSKRTHTHTHTHYLLTQLWTDTPIHRHTFPCVSHTNTLEVLLLALSYQPSTMLIIGLCWWRLVGKRSLLITSCW